MHHGAEPTGGWEAMPGSLAEAGVTQRRTVLRTASRCPHRRCVDRSADCALTGVPLRLSEREPLRPATSAPPGGWHASTRLGAP